MVNLSVNLAGVELKNPIIPTSGTFGYGREYAELYDLNILGSFSWKGTTGEARLGNPQPRIAEMTGGMLNAVGLQNPGIDAVIEKEVPNIAKIFQGPVIANVGGFSLEEYAENCRKLNAVEQVKLLEVNISCPNVHAGGKNFGCDPKAAAEVTKAVKAVHSLPQLKDGQFSFEARMGCGFGACMGCTVPTRDGYKRVCKDGPILYKEEIVW